MILAPDGKSLYIAAGNHTDCPMSELRFLPRIWEEDQLLPRMWDGGRLMRSGWRRAA